MNDDVENLQKHLKQLYKAIHWEKETRFDLNWHVSLDHPKEGLHSNLVAYFGGKISGGSDVDAKMDEKLSDVLLMLGKFTHDNHSIFWPRVVEMLVAADALNWGWHKVEAEVADKWVKEFCICWKLVMKEFEFANKEPKKPEPPKHEDDADDWLTEDEICEKNTKFIRERGFYNVNKLISALQSYEKVALDHKVDNTRKGWKEVKIDFQLLQQILNTDTSCTWDKKDVNKKKLDVVKNLRQSLDAACKTVNGINSKTYDKLVDCQQFMELYDSKNYSNDKIAEFITSLKEAYDLLILDIKNTPPPSKRKKRGKSKADKPYKGTQTEDMNSQYEEFCAFITKMKKEGEYDTKSLHSWANIFYEKSKKNYPNGYPSVTTLYNRYRIENNPHKKKRK